ncbi:MAG TPA: molybdenum cofactor guanylyltransferase [bacterium]|nr:molybdenum cofactor guanylyltransferase [bacterium]
MEGEITISVSAYILTGGDSRRFGENKALYRYQGKPLIQHALDHLLPWFTSINIIAKDPEPYASLGYMVIRDIMDQQTPLVGILTGLTASDTAWNFFTACDVPFLTEEVISELLEEVSADEEIGIRAVVPVTSQGSQPLVGCYHRELIDSLGKAIDRNQSVKVWLRQVATRDVYFHEMRPFRNINRKEDLNARSVNR